MRGTPPGASGTVVVVGGGLAGTAAALEAADAGCEVVLLERRPALGGLTRSFVRTLPDGSPLVVDNGQHVLLRCFTAHRALLERLGTAGDVELTRLDLPVRAPAGPAGGTGGARRVRTARLRRGALPAPAHLLPVLTGYRLLGVRQRLAVARAVAAVARLDTTDPAVDARSLASFLDEHHQDAAVREAVWDVLCVATLNATAERASLALAATVVQRGLLAGRRDGDVGWSAVPLQRLHGDAAARALARAGVRVRTRAVVTALAATADGRWRATTRGGGAVEADAVVLAVPPAAAEALAPAGAVALAPGWSRRLGSSPILDVHLVLDRRVLDQPLVAGAGSVAQWVFDRTASSGLEPRPAGSGVGGHRRQYLVVSVSAAHGLVDAPAARVVAVVRDALAALHPALSRARVLDAFVTREREATFDQRPGSAAHRPPSATAVPTLALAGAWTATGWPATMEGAVRSGHAGAAAVLTGLGVRHRPARAPEHAPPAAREHHDQHGEPAAARAAGPTREVAA